MSDEIVTGERLEVVVRADGKAVWLHLDGVQVMRFKVERVEVEDQRQTTIAETLGYVATEIRELRLKASQYAEMNKRKRSDAQAERRYGDGNRYEGRQEVWERVAAILDKMIREHGLKERS